jgi:hypothetical protein
MPTAAQRVYTDRTATEKYHYIYLRKAFKHSLDKKKEFLSKASRKQVVAKTVGKPLETTGRNNLYHKFTLRDAEDLPEGDWDAGVKEVITWDMDNGYPAWLLLTLRWFGPQVKLIPVDGKQVYAVAAKRSTHYLATEFIRILDKFMNERGTVSADDAVARPGDRVIAWAGCSSSDKAAYLELTKDFDSENALTFEEVSGNGSVCRFSYNGDNQFESTRMVDRIVNKVQLSAVSWKGQLASELAVHTHYGWVANREPEMLYPCVGILALRGHHAVLYCPAWHPNGHAEEWFYVDSWRQPPLTGGKMKEFKKLQKVWPKKITHLPTVVTQLPGEGSCSAVSLMKAFAIANVIHLMDTLTKRSTIDDMEFYQRKCASVHKVATGIRKDGTRDMEWLKRNSCFAKLAHRMVRIYESPGVKWSRGNEAVNSLP